MLLGKEIGLGKEMKFAWTAKGSPFGGAAEQSEAERARPLNQSTPDGVASSPERGSFFCGRKRAPSSRYEESIIKTAH